MLSLFDYRHRPSPAERSGELGPSLSPRLRCCTTAQEKRIANRHCPQNSLVIGHQETRMTELEVIAKNILGLKQLLRVAWEDLGSTHLSLFERREIRSQMRRAAADLHHALQDFQDEHDRLRKLHAEKCEKEAPRRVKLRLVD